MLTDLSHPLIDELSCETQLVLQDEAPVETKPGVWHLPRISPYGRAGTSRLGFVVALVNVNALKPAHQNLEKRKEIGSRSVPKIEVFETLAAAL